MPVYSDPRPNWVTSPSVMDPAWQRGLKTALDLTGYSDPKSELLGPMNPLSAPVALGMLPTKFIGNKLARQAATDEAVQALRALGPEYEKGAAILAARYPRQLSEVAIMKSTPANSRFSGTFGFAPQTGQRTIEISPETVRRASGVLPENAANTAAHELAHSAQAHLRTYRRPLNRMAELSASPLSMPGSPVESMLQAWPKEVPMEKVTYFYHPDEVGARTAGTINAMRTQLQDPSVPTRVLRASALEQAQDPRKYYEWGTLRGHEKLHSASVDALRNLGYQVPAEPPKGYGQRIVDYIKTRF